MTPTRNYPPATQVGVAHRLDSAAIALAHAARLCLNWTAQCWRVVNNAITPEAKTLQRLAHIVAMLACGTIASQAAIFNNTFTTQAAPGFLIVQTNISIPGGLTADYAVLTNGFLFMKNPVTRGVLRDDGNTIGNAIWTTNLDILNITNLTIINEFKVQGKSVSFTSFNGTNVAPVNFTNSATVTWAVSGSNVTATASGGVTTDVTTMTYSGTNNASLDMSTNGMSFFVTLTNHILVGTFSNLPAKTAYKTYTFCFQQDSSGGWVPKLRSEEHTSELQSL